MFLGMKKKNGIENPAKISWNDIKIEKNVKKGVFESKYSNCARDPRVRDCPFKAKTNKLF